MNSYKTKYIDKKGIVNTKVFNKFNETSTFCLFLDIEGVKFQGSSFDDFEIIEKEKHSISKLERFTLNKLKYHNSDDFILELCNCTIEVEIPILLINKSTTKEVWTTLEMRLKLGKPKENGGIDYENAYLKLNLNNELYKSESDGFEIGFENLQKQFEDKYAFKNCFGCLYSDYSPIGNGFFGNMQCFRDNKKAYLKAEEKMDYLLLSDKGFITVQETYLCNDFKQRTKNTGYRG